MIKLVADSSCDCLKMPDSSFEAVPLTISTDESSYRDDALLDTHEMLDELAEYKGRSYTACPSVVDWIKAFGGADTVYVGTITSALSGAYNSAMAARDLYLQERPDAQVHIFDTLSTGPELRLLMEKLSELTADGMSFEEVCHKATEYLHRTQLFFSLQSLHNMAQNGRISKVVAATVGVLGIRIVGTASPEGTLQPISKCRGEGKALSELISQLTKAGYSGGKVRICHVENPGLADKLMDRIRGQFPEADLLSYPARGLCSYYAERGAILVGFET